MVIVNAQEWLEKNYPEKGECIRETNDSDKYSEGWNNKGKTREEIKKLDLSNKNLGGKMIIQNFPNLEKVKCGGNKSLESIELNNLPKLDYFHANNCRLTSVKINGCPNIAYFNVANNLLYTNLLNKNNDLNGLDPKKLTVLSIHTNNFPKQDLEFFSRFTKLEQLFLDNNDEDKFRGDCYNKFYGSLEPLSSCENLEILSIGNTDISEGLEHLPEKIRKIGVVSDAWQEKNGHLKIRQELEEAFHFIKKVEGVISQQGKIKDELGEEIQIPEISEGDKELKKSRENNDPEWLDNYYRVAPWKKMKKLQEKGIAEKVEKIISEQGKKNFNKWLDENYPEDGTCQRQGDKENEGKKRSDIEKLSIRELKKLKEFKDNPPKILKMEGFIKLEELDCSSNQFVRLDLSNFRRLTKLDCSKNELTNLDFLNHEEEVGLHYPEKLKVLKISGNNFKDLKKEGLSVFSKLHRLTELTELSIEDCPFEGSLYHLKGLNKLQKIYISNTNISEGLEYLPSSCQEVYCNFGYQTEYKSVNIVKELGKYLELGENKDKTRCYNLKRWKEEKQGGIATIISLERLYIIRNNMKKFINRWGKEAESSNYYEEYKRKFVNYWKNQSPESDSSNQLLESNFNELSKLQSPEEFNTNRYTKNIKWIARTGAVAGGILSLNDNSIIGGTLSAALPFVEIVASQMEEKLYNAKERKWEEFIDDTKNLLDNYHELAGMIKPIEIGGGLGEIKKAFDDLKQEVDNFLNEYDKEQDDRQKNGIIDIDELTNQEARKRIARDLARENESKEGSQLGNIVKAIHRLENTLTDYRQTLYGSMNETEVARMEARKRIDIFFKEKNLKFDNFDKSLWQDSANLKEYLSKLEEPEEINKFVKNIIVKGEEVIKTRETRFVERWKNASGLSSSDSELVEWLIAEDGKNYTDPQWVKSNLKRLREEHKKHKKIHAQSVWSEQKNISNFKENKPSQEIYELVDLQSREEVQIEQPPYGTPGSSKK